MYTLDIALALGSSQTGLTLSAQLVDTTGANVGGAIGTGFVEIGQGNYLWHYAAFPDGHRGGVKFSAGATLKAFVAINPEEAERVDAKVSSVSGGGGSLAGAGSRAVTITVTRPDGTTPIEGAAVWVSTDAAGSNVVAGTLSTDTLGRVTVYLDNGTYYVWRQATSWNLANPQAITVS